MLYKLSAIPAESNATVIMKRKSKSRQIIIIASVRKRLLPFPLEWPLSDFGSYFMLMVALFFVMVGATLGIS
ncbi:MAG: hypothetical protein ABI606_22850 [Rhodoferax sp.]